MAVVLYRRGDIFEVGTDLTVLPCSAAAHFSKTAEAHINRFGLPLPPEQPLGRITVHRFPGPGTITRYIAWAASVMAHQSRAEIIVEIGRQIGLYANSNAHIQFIEAPLLGTGAGGLESLVAGKALREGFLEACVTDATLIIYAQPSELVNQLRSSANDLQVNSPVGPQGPPGAIRGEGLRVFLCHANEDKAVVRSLYDQLRQSGCTPWFDEANILPGQNWRDEISKAVRTSDAIIVCISQHSMKTGYLQKEIRIALDVADERPPTTIFVIPARLAPCDVPERLQHLQWVNLYEETGYNRLLRALESAQISLARPADVHDGDKDQSNSTLRQVNKVLFLVKALADDGSALLLNTVSADWKTSLFVNATIPDRPEVDHQVLTGLLGQRLAVPPEALHLTFDRHDETMITREIKESGDKEKERLYGPRAHYTFSYCVVQIDEPPQHILTKAFHVNDVEYHWISLNALKSNPAIRKRNYGVLEFITRKFDQSLMLLPAAFEKKISTE